MCGALNSLIGLSPPGSRPDCFRHYEFLLGGTVLLTSEHEEGTHTLRKMLEGLPVIFAEDGGGWEKINCTWLMERLVEISQRTSHAHDDRVPAILDLSKAQVPSMSVYG